MTEMATLGRRRTEQRAGYDTLWQRTARDLRNNGQLYLMAVPIVLGFLLFRFVPMHGLVIVFQDYNLVRGILGSKWIGLANFARFAKDPYFFRVVRNTVVLGVLDTLVSFPLPIILALSLNEVRRRHDLFKRITQSISYLPHFVAVVVVIGLVGDLFKAEGVVNRALALLGLPTIRFLGVSAWFRPLYIGSHVWQETGWSSIIYLAALSAIPLEQYESAIVDGASRWQQIIYITLPGIFPTVRLIMILS
ncbi:MAG: ABC transporter permease subunit, partial [Anaerolineae bacterium]|nr:ABC transporter permease subunit [Anaerolineae bacterium]